MLAAAAAFVLAVWLRMTLQPGATALERLIAERAPAENVQALATLPNGDLVVGTSLGLITGNGRKWTRLPGLETNVASVVPMDDGAFVVAGRGTGVVRFKDGALMPLSSGDTEAVAHLGGGRLIALVQGGLYTSIADTGWKWTKLADFGTEPMIALAANGTTLAVGGLQGAISMSRDGGQTWEPRSAPGGSVTALHFDPSKAGRLWASAGGAAYFSDDDGTTWHRGKRSVSDRPLVALAPRAGSGAPLRGVTADGLLIDITE